MAFDIDYFLKINNTYGTTSQKDVQLYNLKSQINDRFADTIDCYKVKINDVDRELLIIRTVNQNEKTIKSRPDENFSVGDYVTFDNKTWLVISKDECNQAYTTGIIKLANYILKFQHPTTGTILSYPCIDESSSSVGIDENTTITTLNGIHKIKLPFDDNTKLLKLGKRLFLDKENLQVFKITQTNNTQYNYGSKGLLEVTLERDEINESTDRTDLGICDYFIPNSNTPTTGYSHTVIACSNPENNLVVGSSDYVLLTPTFYDSSGLVTTSIIPVWTFVYPTGYDNYFLKTYNGKMVSIKVLQNYDLVGKSLTVNVSNGSGGYTGHITLSITM